MGSRNSKKKASCRSLRIYQQVKSAEEDMSHTVLSRLGFDAIWLMGVWSGARRGSRSRTGIWACWRVSSGPFRDFQLP